MPMLTSPCSRNGNSDRNRALAIFSLAAAFSLTGCFNDPAWVAPAEALHADVPASIDLRKIIRELPMDSMSAMAVWHERTGEFGADYVADILRIGEPSDARCMNELKRFTSHPDVAPIELAIDSTSGDSEVMASHEQTLMQAFQRFHYFFPQSPLPAVAWMNSGFNYAVYPTESALGIGLDWFLGPEHPIVGTLAPHVFPQYMRNRMQPDLIPTTAMRGWLLVHFSNPWYRTELCVDELLYWGKILFILEQCLPETPQHTLLDWSVADWAWAEAHERDVWMELQPQDALFASDRLEFGRWFSEGPFTKFGAIPQESPDRLGAYIGWRMVSEYMADHPETTLSQLITITDYTPIVKAYRPK